MRCSTGHHRRPELVRGAEAPRASELTRISDRTHIRQYDCTNLTLRSLRPFVLPSETTGSGAMCGEKAVLQGYVMAFSEPHGGAGRRQSVATHLIK
jgi:hypothetical protein